MRFRKQARTDNSLTATVYYASDLHGSELCWRKFLGASRHYGAQHLVMGGDLTGKAIVPVVSEAGGTFRADFLGEVRHAGSDAELADLEQAVRFNGMYPWVATPEEIAAVSADEAAREGLFEDVMIAELGRWIDLADERIERSGFSMYVMAGNDDPWSCDSVLAGAARATFCDDRVVRVGAHEMISLSYANPTPWSSPRELDEDELYGRMKTLAEALDDPATAIFNLHVPPYASGLDTAMAIDEDLTVVQKGGQPQLIPVGSSAVRELIEEYQPLLGLHGHIHESRGEAWIGRTLVVNSGSEYNSGRIHGVVVKLAGPEIADKQFVVG